MRTIGLLGGMSWESSALYYRLANEIVRDRLGGLHSAHCVLYSVDFAGIAAMQQAGSWDAAAVELAEAGRGLESAGADMVLLCTNTMHKVADQVQSSLTVPLLHIADTTAEAVATAGLGRVGLLGTAFTMEQAFYRERLATHGLDVVVPGPRDQALVHRVIYDELCLGIVSDKSREAYREVIARLVDDGAEGILLACTEIELLIAAADSPVAVFPTTRLHVVAAVDLALADGA
jgi:aspartate racemase